MQEVRSASRFAQRWGVVALEWGLAGGDRAFVSGAFGWGEPDPPRLKAWPAPPTAKPTSLKNTWIALGAAAVLVLAAVGIGSAVSGGRGSSGSGSSTVEASPDAPVLSEREWEVEMKNPTGRKVTLQPTVTETPTGAKVRGYVGYKVPSSSFSSLVNERGVISMSNTAAEPLVEGDILEITGLITEVQKSYDAFANDTVYISAYSVRTIGFDQAGIPAPSS